MGRPRVHIILLKVFYSSAVHFWVSKSYSSRHRAMKTCGVTSAYSLIARWSMWENIWSDHDDCHHPFTLGWEWAHGAIACVYSPHAPCISSHLDYYAMINKVRTSASQKSRLLSFDDSSRNFWVIWKRSWRVSAVYVSGHEWDHCVCAFTVTLNLRYHSFLQYVHINNK